LADRIFGVDDAIMGGIECYWWKFWRRLRALIEQLSQLVALAGGFKVPTGGSALRASSHVCPSLPFSRETGHSHVASKKPTRQSDDGCSKKKKGLPRGDGTLIRILGSPFIPYLNFVRCVRIQITLRSLENLILHDSSDKFILHN
jgi:hypothetical protein